MAQRNEYNPENPAHKAIAKKIAEKRGSLSSRDKSQLADALKAGNMGKINKILGR